MSIDGIFSESTFKIDSLANGSKDPDNPDYYRNSVITLCDRYFWSCQYKIIQVFPDATALLPIPHGNDMNIEVTYVQVGPEHWKECEKKKTKKFKAMYTA